MLSREQSTFDLLHGTDIILLLGTVAISNPGINIQLLTLLNNLLFNSKSFWNIGCVAGTMIL